EIPHLPLRSRDDERLTDFNIGFFSRQTQIALADGQGRVAADCGSERRRSDAGDAPGVARPDRTKPPWRERGGPASTGASLIQGAAGGPHDADIPGAAA